MRLGPEDGAREGLVTGTVITADESRVVVGSDGGGQITLEATVFFRRGKLRSEAEMHLDDGTMVCSATISGIAVPR